MSMDPADANLPPITSLTPSQRRVLGTMIEKGITVPESYPLTLKALTTGCNQKSARHPITNYSEDDVEDTVNKLRTLGLAAVVHTESGRTERFRQYARKRFSELSEPQIAIVAELLLRGRQPMGELRSRASRMAPAGTLDSIDQLRTELSGLLSMKLIQSDGPLERRGIEIDHNLYEARENKKMAQRTTFDDEPAAYVPSVAPVAAVPTYVSHSTVTAHPAPALTSPVAVPGNTGEMLSRIAALETACAGLRAENRELREELESIRKSLDDLRQALGA